jgi:hypothetical protein
LEELVPTSREPLGDEPKGEIGHAPHPFQNTFGTLGSSTAGTSPHQKRASDAQITLDIWITDPYLSEGFEKKVEMDVVVTGTSRRLHLSNIW